MMRSVSRRAVPADKKHFGFHQIALGPARMNDQPAARWNLSGIGKPVVARLRCFLTFLAIAISSSGALAQQIIFDTDTGSISSSSALLLPSGNVTIDSANGLCTWNFRGNLLLPGGAEVKVTGANRAAILADNIYLGGGNQDGVYFNVSAASDRPGPGLGREGPIAAGDRRSRLGRRRRRRGLQLHFHLAGHKHSGP